MMTDKQALQGLPADQAPAQATSAPAKAPVNQSRLLKRVLALTDFEAEAKRFLPRPIYSHMSTYSETGASLRWNAEAYQDYAFVTRVLLGVDGRSLKKNLFGKTYSMPVGIAPMGGLNMAAYNGDCNLARAAADANIPFVLSGASLTPLEKVAQANKDAWFQVYVAGEDGAIARMLERVSSAGYQTIVLTADSAVASNRENNVRNGFDTPLRPSLRLALDGIVKPGWLSSVFFRTLFDGMPHFENQEPRRPVLSKGMMRDRGARDKLSWAHMDFIRKQWPGKLLVKGILSKEDARIAREHGADGVWISNHGGRQLDGAAAPLRVLPGVVEASKDMPVMIDGGVRRGTDVLKALALGASYVFIGRPFLGAAAVAGQEGAAHAIALMKNELDKDMALLGIRTLDELKREHIMRTRDSI